MPYSPVTVSEDWPLLLTCQQTNRQPLSLANVASIVLVFAPVVGSPPTNLRFVATGSVVVTDPVNGLASFAPSSLDKARLLAGEWQFQPVVTYSSGAVRYGRWLPIEAVNPL